MDEVFETTSVEDLEALRDRWDRRLRTAIGEANKRAEGVCERMISLYQAKIDAKRGLAQDADNDEG